MPPDTMRALTLHKTPGDFKPGPSCWHPVQLSDKVPVPAPAKDEVLVKIHAAAFNHRDLFQRQSLYPGTVFTDEDNGKAAIMGADAVGTVVAPAESALKGSLVLVAPAQGWLESADGPEGTFGILGAVKQSGYRGTFADYIAVRADHTAPCPDHLQRDLAKAATLPLGLVTAYRAVVTKARVQQGHNVLVTGIGGGVAILAAQLCSALGANVFVSSSDPGKLARAKSELGAKGAVNYKDADWQKQLAAQMGHGVLLDAVIDGAGGTALVTGLVRSLRDGARVVVYGQTTGKAPELNMLAVLKNIELKGSTMGSLSEWKEAVRLVGQCALVPVVDETLDSLDRFEDGFERMKRAKQFGKIAVLVSDPNNEPPQGKL